MNSMINYSELRKCLDSSPPDQWERIVSDAVELDTSKVETLKGSVMGFSVSDVTVHDDSIEATVYYVMLGDCAYDEDGPYQDNDGDSYDQDEKEYTFQFTISPSGTNWESE
jgi:hypothetical protein